MARIIASSVLCLLALTLTNAYEIVQDETNGQEFYLVPINHIRHRRQTSIDISKNGPGVRGTIGHQGTLLNNGVHKVDGGGFASKNFRPSSHTTVGGNLGYTHVPSGSNVNVNAQHTKRYGTDLGIQGNANLWQKGNSRLDAVGNYNRHFGGAGGTGKPDYYGGLQFNHRF